MAFGTVLLNKQDCPPYHLHVRPKRVIKQIVEQNGYKIAGVVGERARNHTGKYLSFQLTR